MPVRDLRRLIGSRPIAKRLRRLPHRPLRPPKTPRVSDAFRIARFEASLRNGVPGEHDPHYSLDRTCANRLDGIDQYGSHICAGVAAALARAALL